MWGGGASGEGRRQSGGAQKKSEKTMVVESAEGLMCPGPQQGWRSPSRGVPCLACVVVLGQGRAVSMGIQGILEDGVGASTELTDGNDGVRGLPRIREETSLSMVRVTATILERG